MKLYDLLYKALGQIATLKTNVASALSGNTVYMASGTAAAVYKTNVTICSLTLPAGTYYISGLVYGDISQDASLSASISGLGRALSTLVSGGGVCLSGIETLSTTSTISLQSYGYYNGTYNFSGRLHAAKLLTGGVLRKAIDTIFGRMPSERGCFA